MVGRVVSPTAACRLAALVASAASVGALTPLGRAIAAGSVLCARHAAVPLAALGPLAASATVRNSSISWVERNVRTTSTSDVQRWMMSPVCTEMCQR